MGGKKINQLKEETIKLLDTFLLGTENRAAIITFNTEAQIISDLTDDKEALPTAINNLSTKGLVNHYQALIQVLIQEM